MHTTVSNDPRGRPLLLVFTMDRALRDRLAGEPDFAFEQTYTGKDGEPRGWDVYMSDTATARADAIQRLADGR